MSLIVDEHRQYLSDPHRLDAFTRAIHAVVRPGSVVLDLASGTGILGLIACRAGASRVYSIEVGGMIGVARRVAADNGYAERIRFIKGLSTQVDLPERVDVVVADQIGNFGFNAGVIEYFTDARARFLKPDGVCIPRNLELCVCLMESAVLDGQVEFWNTQPAGFRFDSVHELAANTGYQVELAHENALSDPATLVRLEPDRAASSIGGKASLQVRRNGALHGLGGWFSAELAQGVSMSNSPFSATRIRRRQIFFPARPAFPVAQGDQVDVEFNILPREWIVSWRLRVRSGKTGELRNSRRHSTWNGMLLDRDDLARTSRESVPVLTERGEARRSVVDLCDGKRSLREIENEVRRRHPALFRTEAEAEEFVAEVVTRYAR